MTDNRVGSAPNQPVAIPAVVITRRALGPLLIVVGLFMLDLLKSRISLGRRWSAWLGVAFSFTFCPTLFWLFFGLTVPLAIASTGGVVLPGIFALGTTLPVLGLAALLASGTVNVHHFLKRFMTADIWLQRIAGGVFVLVGLNETLLYWFL